MTAVHTFLARVAAVARRVGPLLVAAAGIALLVVALAGGHRPTGTPTTVSAPVSVPAPGATDYIPVPAGKP